MKAMTKHALVGVLCLVLAAAGQAAGQNSPTGLAGTWIGMTMVPNVGEDPITLELKQEGEIYTGTCADGAGMIVSSTITNATFKDGTLTFDIGVSNGTDTFPVHISLKVDGDTMTGYWTTDQGESAEIKLARKVE